MMNLAKRKPPKPLRVSALIAAGGTGIRLGGTVPKQLMSLAGKPVLIRTVESLLQLDCVREVVIALPRSHVEAARSLLAAQGFRVPIRCIQGGRTRQDSVHMAVRKASETADVLLVHDAARPLCERAMLERVVEAAVRDGAAVPGLPPTETIQRVSKRGRVLKTPPRDELQAIQTPQCFRAAILRSALDRAKAEHFEGTDESSVVRRAGHAVTVVPGSADNLKITYPRDLEIAERILMERTHGKTGRAAPQAERASLRVGQGTDYHRLVKGRKLILGGVEIPFGKGLEGHSDADVLAHAICDALLGAAALGDIGRHFPDTDPAHKNRPSLEFLEQTRRLVEVAGWTIRNVDATILAQAPRLTLHIGKMRANLAKALGLEVAQVSVKATTTERMNAEGRGEGISAQAIALLA